MGRTEGDWERDTADAPYMASTRRDCPLPVTSPPPWLAIARRASRGRILYAFDKAEVRDYFVLGHLDGGAKAEADRARFATASARHPANRPPVSCRRSFDEKLSAARAAERALDEAQAALEKAFAESVDAALAADDPAACVAIWRAMPAESFAKTALGMRLQERGVLGTHARVGPGRPNAAQGAAMLVWLKASVEAKMTADTLDSSLWYEVSRIAHESGPDALEAFAGKLPNVLRAIISEMAEEARTQAEPSTSPGGP